MLEPRVLELLRVQRCSSSFKQLDKFNQFQSNQFYFLKNLGPLLTVFQLFPVYFRFLLHLLQISSLSLYPARAAGSGDIIARIRMTYIFWYEVYLGLTATNPCYFGWYIKGRYTSTNGWSISFRWMITLGDN